MNSIDEKRLLEGEFRAFLSDKDHRDEVESAIIVDLLMEDSTVDPEKVYRRAMDIWESQKLRAPDVRVSDSGQVADVVFIVPQDRSERVLRLFKGLRGCIPRSKRGTKIERVQCEKRWKDHCFSGKFLREVAKRRGSWS